MAITLIFQSWCCHRIKAVIASCVTKTASSLLVFALSVSAQQERETEEDEWGILNPSDGDQEMLVRKLEMGQLDSVTCSLGFNTSKYDNIKLARRFATRCAEAGMIKAMTWMSYLEMNGIGGPVNAQAAAEWDRRAAKAGSPVGMYNYGLDLLRGFGVEQNQILGRRYIDQAADLGLDIALSLQSAGYNVDTVTYDTDTH